MLILYQKTYYIYISNLFLVTWICLPLLSFSVHRPFSPSVCCCSSPTPAFSARSWTGGGEGDSRRAAASLGQKGQSVGELHPTDGQREEGEEGETQRSACEYWDERVTDRSEEQLEPREVDRLIELQRRWSEKGTRRWGQNRRGVFTVETQPLLHSYFVFKSVALCLT